MWMYINFLIDMHLKNDTKIYKIELKVTHYI